MTLLSKRLKKRIQEVCGLTNLSREDKARRALAILNDNEEKQRICNELLGTSFKDIEKTLQEIVSSKKFSTKEQREEQEILEEYPEKIHGPTKPTVNKSPVTMEYLLDQDEVNSLIDASNAPIIDEVSTQQDTNYPTYSQREVIALVDGNYDPAHFQRRR